MTRAPALNVNPSSNFSFFPPRREMNVGPKVTLSALNVTFDERSLDKLPDKIFVKYAYQGAPFVEVGPMTPHNQLERFLTFPASGVVTVEIYEMPPNYAQIQAKKHSDLAIMEPMSWTHTKVYPGMVCENFDEVQIDDNKLGSTQVKLKPVYRRLEKARVKAHTYLYPVSMTCNICPGMQFRFSVSLFPPKQAGDEAPVVHFFAFDMVSEEESSDSDKLFDFILRLVTDVGTHRVALRLTGEQLLKLRDRALRLPTSLETLRVLLLLALLLFGMFMLNESHETFQHSQFIYQDIVACMETLSRSVQRALMVCFVQQKDTEGRKAPLLAHWSYHLLHRYAENPGPPNAEDLQHAVFFLEKAKHIYKVRDEELERWDCPLDHFFVFENLHNAYLALYDLHHRIEDLDSGISAMDAAMKLEIPYWVSPMQKPHALTLFSHSLFARFEVSGDQQDAHRALSCVSEALDVMPQNDYPATLYERMRLLIKRFEWLHNEEDRDRAIEIIEDLIMVIPISDHRLSECKAALAHLLLQRFSPPSEPYYFASEQGYSNFSEFTLAERERIRPHVSVGHEGDLDRAINLFRDLIVSHVFHPLRHRFNLVSLYEALTTRFKLLGDVKDIDEVVEGWRQILDEPSIEFRLGHTLLMRYMFCGTHIEDLRAAMSNLASAAKSTEFAPMRRFISAKMWAFGATFFSPEIYAKERQTAHMEALQTVMDILPSLAWVGRAMHDRHDILTMTEYAVNTPFRVLRHLEPNKEIPRPLYTSIGQAPSNAAEVAIHYSEFITGLEWLEQGRSIIWDQLMQFRTPLDELRKADEQLADRLGSIAKDLAASSAKAHFQTDEQEGAIAWEAEAQKHRKLATAWDEGIAEARKIPGFLHFPRPKTFGHLLDAARDVTVVVINVAQRSDAIVLLPLAGGHPVTVLYVPLPDVTMRDVEGMHKQLISATMDDYAFRALAATDNFSARKPMPAPFPGYELKEAVDPNLTLKDILSKLWYRVVQPILSMCEDVRPSLIARPRPAYKRPRLRWCPTGSLAFLPLHAAGDYDLPEDDNRVFDYVVSSYIPTLTSVIQEKPTDVDHSRERLQILAVACSSAKGQLPIPGTGNEIRRIQAQVASSGEADCVTLTEGNATASQVMEKMSSASWVHFACHGVQNMKSPSESALLLASGTRITISDVAALDLPRAELAFLSACQTATGFDKLPSESVHLAAGMLLAGYRSVIATMWSIEDRNAPRVADDVYGYLLRKGDDGTLPDCSESAVALDLAVEQLRKHVGEKAFMSWVPYIHLGA